METLWFILIALMLTAYVVLDGFDLGAGTIHLFAARSDAERRMVLKAIGPVWDGNEVWLIAAGGTLFFAFPRLYATSFSGFYLPLIMVLWLLIIRGVAIEMRSHLASAVWREFWDGAFFVGSVLLSFFFGVALANVVRGVPIGADGTFFEALWTTFSPAGPSPGVLDWYTVTIGFLALFALVAHGASWVVLKTAGPLADRSRGIAFAAWCATVGLTAIGTWMTFGLRPALWQNFGRWPLGLSLPLLAIGSLAALGHFLWRRQERRAFAASALFLGGMLASTAFALYPIVLPAVDGRYSLTIFTAAASPTSLAIGLVWWTIGMVLALTYFVAIYWLFRGKVTDGEGHY